MTDLFLILCSFWHFVFSCRFSLWPLFSFYKFYFYFRWLLYEGMAVGGQGVGMVSKNKLGYLWCYLLSNWQRSSLIHSQQSQLFIVFSVIYFLFDLGWHFNVDVSVWLWLWVNAWDPHECAHCVSSWHFDFEPWWPWELRPLLVLKFLIIIIIINPLQRVHDFFLSCFSQLLRQYTAKTLDILLSCWLID